MDEFNLIFHYVPTRARRLEKYYSSISAVRKVLRASNILRSHPIYSYSLILIFLYSFSVKLNNNIVYWHEFGWFILCSWYTRRTTVNELSRKQTFFSVLLWTIEIIVRIIATDFENDRTAHFTRHNGSRPFRKLRRKIYVP